MAYATTTDVSVRWGKDLADLDAETIALIEVRLDDVERMIKRRITDLDTQIGDTIDVADVAQVEADAVLRLVRNPDGYLSESDGNYTYMLKSELASGKLEITSEEWEILGVRRARISFLDPRAVLGT